MSVAPPRAHHLAPHADAVWQVALLGGLELRSGTLSITRLPSRAVTALLARLALAPQRAHGREELIELLWPGVATAAGRNRLRQALSTLKTILEPAGREPRRPVLLADRTSVRVVPGALACDGPQFERAVRAGDLATARALYRGELLPGFYDEWIDDERVRLAALHDGLPAEEPPRQPVADHHASAPTARDPAPVLEARVLLPSYLTRLFGADEAAARLRERVIMHRLVTVIGPGGGGKTRLAVEVAQSLRPHADWPQPLAAPDEPFDLIAFVSLASCGTPAQALDAIVTTLQLAAGGDGAPAALARALAGRRTLMLLDNFEQLVDAAAEAVVALLSDSPRLHVLVTSRRPLGVAGEIEFELKPLALPDPADDTDGVAASPAVALFIERARAVRADFHLSARNRSALAALVHELEGMPLAIELAASRVRSIAPAEMLQRLRRAGTPRLELLSRGAGRGDTPARHASMQRALDWSWQLLDRDQATMLSALTAFATSFDAAAAAALLAGEDLDAALVLDSLVAHSLVHRNNDGEQLRFGIYQPIREYTFTRTAAPAAVGWRARLRRWALQWAQALPRTPPLPLLRTEMPNLLAALRSAVDDDAPAEGVMLLLALKRCLEDVNLPAEGLELAALAVERCAEPSLCARGHTLLAPLLFAVGRAEAALRHAELGLAHDGLDPLQRARALHALARVRWRSRRRAGEVEPLLDEATGLLGEDDDELRASLLALRAFVANAEHGDHAGGEALHAQALALWERLGNQHAIDSGRYNLAVCAQNAKRDAECLARLDQVIASAREQQDWRRLSQSLNVRGNACCGLRDWPRAVHDYQECIRTAWTAMASYDLAFGLWNLPRALLHRRCAEAAVRLQSFAAAFWRGGFGELSVADVRYLVRFQRLAQRLLPPARYQSLWREGETLPLQQAVATALATAA